MSVLNDIAKRAYELPGVVTNYLANKILLESRNPIRAEREADIAEGYIDKYFTGFGSEAQFLEIGSGGGDEARYMMKRGLNVEAVHFASPPYTSENARNKVLTLAGMVSEYQGKMKVHIVNFTDIQLNIYKTAGDPYAVTLMRRMMFRMAEKIAQKNG